MDRATSPVVGVALLLGVTVVAAALVGGTALGVDPRPPGEHVAFAVAADAGTGQITVTHDGGDALDARDLSLSIRVDGEALDHQPPIPYVGARGFAGSPEGPFNAAAEPRWSAGERASVEIAGTNDPTLAQGDEVTVVLATEHTVLTEEETDAA